METSPIAFSDTDRGSWQNRCGRRERDQTMNTIDGYFEYKIPIEKNMVWVDILWYRCTENEWELPNGQTLVTRWIQFKVPIDKNYYQGTNFAPYFNTINGIQDLRSVRFMRMVLSGFEQPVVMRFGTLDLVRGDWRRYNRSLNEEVVVNRNTTVDISTVNILENENRIPVNYVLPPEIQREQINNNNTIVRQNEQSLSFRVCDLQPMDSRGIFKGVDVDLRQYKLKMCCMPSQFKAKPILEKGERRLWSPLSTYCLNDYQDNYYQIEVPQGQQPILKIRRIV